MASVWNGTQMVVPLSGTQGVLNSGPAHARDCCDPIQGPVTFSPGLHIVRDNRQGGALAFRIHLPECSWHCAATAKCSLSPPRCFAIW